MPDTTKSNPQDDKPEISEAPTQINSGRPDMTPVPRPTAIKVPSVTPPSGSTTAPPSSPKVPSIQVTPATVPLPVVPPTQMNVAISGPKETVRMGSAPSSGFSPSSSPGAPAPLRKATVKLKSRKMAAAPGGPGPASAPMPSAPRPVAPTAPIPSASGPISGQMQQPRPAASGPLKVAVPPSSAQLKVQAPGASAAQIKTMPAAGVRTVSGDAPAGAIGYVAIVLQIAAIFFLVFSVFMDK